MPKTPTDSRGVAISYDNSSYADFLFYLFYRSAGVFPELKTAFPLDGIAPLADDSFLPNDVATSEIENYAALYRIASTYDAHVEFTELLQQGEPRFAAFSSFLQAANANKRTRVQTVPNPKDSDRVELFRAKSVPLIIGTALGLVWLKHGVAW